eukprot:5693174-Prorocentrum_lima.AAC.1
MRRPRAGAAGRAHRHMCAGSTRPRPRPRTPVARRKYLLENSLFERSTSRSKRKSWTSGRAWGVRLPGS